MTDPINPPVAPTIPTPVVPRRPSSRIVVPLLVAIIAISGYLVYAQYKNLGTSVPAASTTVQPVSVGISFADPDGRWVFDEEFFVAKVKELGSNVTVVQADSDADRQALQVKKLILQGVQVLVVIPEDAERAASIVSEAHKAGIKVISYDRLIKNADVDYYISFDNYKVGEYQAKSVLDVKSKGNFAYIGGAPTDNNSFQLKQGAFKLLQPKIDSGDIKLVINEFTPDWRAADAYKVVSTYLAKKGNTLDGIVAANDSLAAAAIQALSEHGLAGKVPISGQDAELSACRSIINGLQTATVYKPIKKLADAAAIMAIAVARGEPVVTNTLVNNGKNAVPSSLLDVLLVTKENMRDTVIKDGFYTEAEVYGTP